MNRRDVTLRLLELQRGVVEGSLDRPALLSALAELYSSIGGDRSDLAASLPPGTQLAIEGEQGAEAAARRASAAQKLRERAVRIVRYWIVRTGRDPKRTEVSEDRIRKVSKILKTKSDEEAMQAIANVAESDFHAGDNERGGVYMDIGLIFRSIEKFEHHRDMGDASIKIDVELDESVGKQPEKPSADDLRAQLAEATERKNRALKGNDRDAFNRFAALERKLRRALDQAVR